MFQILLTPSAGKRLIGKATAKLLFETEAIRTGIVGIIAGTTNAYVAEELLAILGQAEGFSRERFFRGITTAGRQQTVETGRLRGESQFFGDVIINKGTFVPGKTIDDYISSFGAGDVIVKGANCVNRAGKMAGILIGHSEGGTIMKIMPAVIGRRTRLIIPVGLEKRVSDDIGDISALLNTPGSSGFRMMPVFGELITEIEAIRILYGLSARLVAGGGVSGAEGAIWIVVEGEKELLRACESNLRAICLEPQFAL